MPEGNPFIQAEKNRVNALKEFSLSLKLDPEFAAFSADEVMAQIGNILNYPEETKQKIFQDMATKPGVYGSDDPELIRQKLKELWTPLKPNESIDRVKKYLPEGFDFSAYVPGSELGSEFTGATEEQLHKKWWADFQQAMGDPKTFGNEVTPGDVRKPEYSRTTKLSTRAEPQYWFANRIKVASPEYADWEPVAVINDLKAVVNTKDPALKQFQLKAIQADLPDLFGHMTLAQIEDTIRKNLGLNTVEALSPEEQRRNLSKGRSLTRVLLNKGRSTNTVPFIYPQKKTSIQRPTQTTQPEQNPTPTIRRKLSQ